MSRAILFALALALLPAQAAFGETSLNMDPAPADRLNYEFERRPGEFKRTGEGLIDPSPDVVSLEYLPKDEYGFVDWTRALDEGVIAPRDTLKGRGAEAADNVGDVVLKSRMAFMPDVIFPHGAHTLWLKCSNCHPRIFREKAGATGITMAGIWKGRYCGRCHDKVAFPTRNCFKCHSAGGAAKAKR